MALVSVGLNFSALADTKCGFDCDNSVSVADWIILCLDSSTSKYGFYMCDTSSQTWKPMKLSTFCDDTTGKQHKGELVNDSKILPGDNRQVFMDSTVVANITSDNGLNLSEEGAVFTDEIICWKDTTATVKCYKKYICLNCVAPKEWDSTTNKCKDPGGGNVDPGIIPPAEVKGEIKCGVECKDQTDLYLFCPNEPVSGDSSVFKCENKKWIETDMTAWCCNTTCSAPNDSSLRDVGIWTLDTGHHLYSSSSPIEGGRSYVFYTGKEAAENKQNCTVCPHGTKYDRQENKCK